MFSLSLTDDQRVRVIHELNKAKNEAAELQNEMERDVLRASRGGFDTTELSPKQHKILDSLDEKKLLIEALEQLLGGKKVLGSEEEKLRDRLVELRKEIDTVQKGIKTIVSIQSRILSMLRR